VQADLVQPDAAAVDAGGDPNVKALLQRLEPAQSQPETGIRLAGRNRLQQLIGRSAEIDKFNIEIVLGENGRGGVGALPLVFKRLPGGCLVDRGVHSAKRSSLPGQTGRLVEFAFQLHSEIGAANPVIGH
jgi:hypothetical protein